MDEKPVRVHAEGRLRAARIIWGAALACVGLYALLGFKLLPESRPASVEATEVNVWLGPLFIVSLVLLYLSFREKYRMLSLGAESGRRDLAPKAFFIALAFCEAAALVGLFGIYLAGHPFAFGIVAVGAVGLLLHFPRREQFSAAAGRTAVEG